MNQHHDDLVAERLGASDEVNLGGMGVHRFEAETQTLLQQLPPLLFGQLGSFVAVGFWFFREHEPGQQIGIHKRQPQRLQSKPVKRALPGPIAAHEHP